MLTNLETRTIFLKWILLPKGTLVALLQMKLFFLPSGTMHGHLVILKSRDGGAN